VSRPLERLRQNYRPALLAHLSSRKESGLRAAYELGRAAIAERVSMLDLVQIHHEVFVEVALTVRSVDELPDMLDGAATFLVEALAPFEMTRHAPARRVTGRGPGPQMPPQRRPRD
jgi:Phosphoserine phosphatase RsbU, N-terminal domain